MLTWLQLGYHQKPVAFLNIDGFYDHLLAFFDHCTTQVCRAGHATDPTFVVHVLTQ